MQIYNWEVTGKQYWTTLGAVIILAAIAVVVGLHVRATHVAQIRKSAKTHVAYSFGPGKPGDAYLNFDSGNEQILAGICGSTQKMPTYVGNFKVNLVRQINLGKFLNKIIPIYTISSYPLYDYTFASQTQDPFEGNFFALPLKLTKYPADTLVINQYEDCNDYSATLLNTNPTTKKIQPFEFQASGGGTTSHLFYFRGKALQVTGTDTMDSILLSGQATPYEKIHWKFDSKLGKFVETGKDLSK